MKFVLTVDPVCRNVRYSDDFIFYASDRGKWWNTVTAESGNALLGYWALGCYKQATFRSGYV